MSPSIYDVTNEGNIITFWIDAAGDMPYYNVTTHTLYQSIISADWGMNTRTAIEKAEQWVEAENTTAVFALISAWFELIESGEAELKQPDPFWESPESKAPLTLEVADKFISEMDEDFMMERSRFQGRLAPEFSRLSPQARMAFMQAVYGVILTTVEIKAEAARRLGMGEEIPPKAKP